MADQSTIARPYAKAAFEVASAAKDLDGWAEALAAAAAIVRDEAVRTYLRRPELDAKERARFVSHMCEGVPGGKLLGKGAGENLLKLLSENDRLAALPEISTQFDALKIEAESKVKARLITATKVDAAQAAKVAKALEQKLGRKVDLEVVVDPTLLGGAIVRAEDMMIDGSVRSRLERLAATMVS
jgi:F-type H+-transporting ATPase subunit delta